MSEMHFDIDGNCSVEVRKERDSEFTAFRSWIEACPQQYHVSKHNPTWGLVEMNGVGCVFTKIMPLSPFVAFKILNIL